MRERVYSSRELTQYFLDRIHRLDSRLNSFVIVTPERALAQADAADRRLARAGSPSDDCTLLTGIPMAHKDLFCTQGVTTACGSRMLANFVAPYDATAVAHLDDAGAVMLGKTNMDEFAMGSSNENSWFGAVGNPWDPERVPGGSSGGSAAAVAAGLVPVATGTDTGGSIRQPAAFCGLSGIKPTYGRISRYGMVAFASSLDQAGVFAHDAADLALVLAYLAGADARDSTSSTHIDPWLEAARHTPLAPPDRAPVIGLPREYFAGLRVGGAAQEAARRVFEAAGCTVRDISLPHSAMAIPAYYIIAGAEASTNLSRFDGVRYGHRCENPTNLDDLYRRSRTEGFGREVKRRILTGTYALSVGYFEAYYVKAQQLRRLIQNDFLAAFESVDLILTPTAPGVAFPRNDFGDDPIAMYQQDIFTVPASLAGLPAMSLPCGFHDGLPLGLQLIGPHFGEQTLLQAGALFQRETDWHRQHPEAFSA
ncbi:MAG: Asp-tRNA(Asn)/Glu-tRNA(Gln) amidotransferase subunit GatA [Gammaproteobacteria bacterium]